ncbi:hypothetical protein MRX96_043548 [Rhipicephalus microplus]
MGTERDGGSQAKHAELEAAARARGATTASSIPGSFHTANQSPPSPAGAQEEGTIQGIPSPERTPQRSTPSQSQAPHWEHHTPCSLVTLNIGDGDQPKWTRLTALLRPFSDSLAQPRHRSELDLGARMNE